MKRPVILGESTLLLGDSQRMGAGWSALPVDSFLSIQSIQRRGLLHTLSTILHSRMPFTSTNCMDGFPWNTFKLTLLSASQGAKRLTSHISITVDISAEAQHTAFGTWEPYGSGWRGPSLLPALQTQTKPLKHSEIHCPCPTDEAIDIRSVVLGVLGESVW